MRPKPIVEVAFVLDTTGSMGPLIEGAKRKIWSIATAIVDANPDAEIRMGLVAYRDIGDEYVTKTFNLTTDIQDLYANLLELKARGGGDWPESVNEALEVGVTKLAGRKARKSAASCSWSATRRRTWTTRRTPNIRTSSAWRMTAASSSTRCRPARRARHRAGVARDRPARRRPLHPDPAGRRADRDHRDAVGHRDHRTAGPHQRHGDPLRPARATLQRRAEDPPGRGRVAVGCVRDGRLSEQERRGFRLGRHRARRSRRRCHRRPAEARQRQGRGPARQPCAP